MVRTIFESYSQGGRSQRSIAAEFNSAGMLRPDAQEWTGKQIGRILDNPAYVGRCVLDGEFVAGNWEPIVDAKTWEQARAVRATDKRRTSLLRVAKGGPYLLSGMLYCGHCDRKLVHRATHNGQRDSIYVCIEAGGKWCPGGSIASARADEFVSQRFLDRCSFMIQGREVASFRDGERAWSRASMEEPRALLSLTIARVVLVPWPGGTKPRRQSPRRRELRIRWAPAIKDRAEAVVLAEPCPPPKPHRRMSEGRAEMMREMEAAKLREDRRQRSERSRAYYREWNARRRHLRD
jgi:hypothetical protein